MEQRGRQAREGELETAAGGQVWAVYGTRERGVSDASGEQVATHLERRGGGPEGEWLWLHLDVVAGGVSRRVRTVKWLPEEAEDTLLRPGKDLRISYDDGILHGTLPGLERGIEGAEPEVVPWHFALRPDTLITTRRRPIPGLFALRRSLGKGGGGVPEFPAEVIDRALLGFADELRRMIAALDTDLDRVEDALLAPGAERPSGSLGGELGRTRRFATALRRAIGPLDRIIHDENLEVPDWAEDALLDRARPAVRSVMDDLLALQGRAQSMQDELASRQAEETNRRLYLVSIMTTLMLPATFVTGFFGMNTGGMFLASGKHGTVAAGSVCLLFMAMTWLLLKRLKLL